MDLDRFAASQSLDRASIFPAGPSECFARRSECYRNGPRAHRNAPRAHWNAPLAGPNTPRTHRNAPRAGPNAAREHSNVSQSMRSYYAVLPSRPLRPTYTFAAMSSASRAAANGIPADSTVCPYCQKLYKKRGYSQHVEACKRRHTEALEDLQLQAQLKDAQVQGMVRYDL